MVYEGAVAQRPDQTGLATESWISGPDSVEPFMRMIISESLLLGKGSG
jgi:hypothetical protein